MTWQLDPAHSTVEFASKHMMISTVRGHFTKFEATVELDENDLTNSSVSATIDAASVETRVAPRDAHLRSADFLDVENYPTITFKSTKIEQVKGDDYLIHGDLTIRGTTRPVVLETRFEGIGASPWGTQVAGFNARAAISRKDWGLTYNIALETGGVVVSDRINLSFEIELIKQEAAVPALAGANA